MPTLVSRNPRNGDAVGEVPTTAVGEIPELVKRARSALSKWREVSLEERGALLERAGERLVERAEKYGDVVSLEMGKPLPQAIGEVRFTGSSISKKVRNAIRALQPVVHSNEKVETTIFQDPLGVCACITPWNYPISMPNWMAVPALMAGNTVVLKPSEETPLTAQAYVDTLNEFLPEHVLQICHGGDDVGRALVAADVALVAFTGSREVGQKIMASAAKDLKRLVLELGGKDPLIVLDDADLDAAAHFAVDNSFDNSGQVCVSTERVLVHESVLSDFEERVSKIARGYSCETDGNGDVQLGPMVNEHQRSHVINQIEQAVQAGARVVVGGSNHPEHYVTPTVLTNVADAMDIAINETFGPVLCISSYADVQDAVKTANASPYGLGAVVFGKDEERAYSIARQIDAGMIGVNKSISGTGDTPWVGAKQSGYGYHGSPDGHRQFAQTRVITRPKT